MSERFSFRWPAGEPGSPAVYTPEAAAHLLHQPFLLNQEGGKEPRGGRVVSAEVIEDGAALMVTVEVPDGSLPKVPGKSLSGFSIAKPQP